MFLETAVKAGVPVSDFWDMTPMEAQMCMNAYIDRRDGKLNEIRSQAWLIAALSRAKKMPDYNEFVNPPKPKTEQEIEEDKKYFAHMRERAMTRRLNKQVTNE